MKHRKQRSPNYDRVIIENCINAYVDGGNSITAMWDYLKRLITIGDITEPYAKQKSVEALNVIKGAERLYKTRIGE